MARIVWTRSEKDAIFARMETEFRQRPHLARKDALRTAQSVLDSSRWIVVTDQRVFNYKDRIEIARQKALQESRKTPEKAVEAPAAILAPTPAPERPETPKGRLADILELLLDVVAESVAARVADSMRPAMAMAELDRHAGAAFDTEYAKRPKHDPQPVPHLTGRPRPGVLIIGLLPAQAACVFAGFNRELDLSFFTAEEAVTCPKLVRAHTVLMTKFINHAVQDKYRKAPELHWCNGGLAACMAILDSIKAPVL